MRRIRIDDQALREFVQYRSRSYDAAAVAQILERLSPEGLEDVIDDLIREEALHREAKALNLDANDYVIRRRLVQKMEFIAEGSAATVELREGDAERHYEQNLDDYTIEPAITFTHVYFDRQRRGAEAARALAVEKRDELNQLAAPLAAATRHGDRFLYHVNYVERTPEFVASHFGKRWPSSCSPSLRTLGAGAGRSNPSTASMLPWSPATTPAAGRNSPKWRSRRGRTLGGVWRGSARRRRSRPSSIATTCGSS